jgi:ribulose kinase
MAAATAAGLHTDLPTAAAAMARDGARIVPDAARKARLDQDWRVFLLMHEHRRAIESLMAG